MTEENETEREIIFFALECVCMFVRLRFSTGSSLLFSCLWSVLSCCSDVRFLLPFVVAFLHFYRRVKYVDDDDDDNDAANERGVQSCTTVCPRLRL